MGLGRLMSRQVVQQEVVQQLQRLNTQRKEEVLQEAASLGRGDVSLLFFCFVIFVNIFIDFILFEFLFSSYWSFFFWGGVRREKASLQGAVLFLFCGVRKRIDRQKTFFWLPRFFSVFLLVSSVLYTF